MEYHSDTKELLLNGDVKGALATLPDQPRRATAYWRLCNWLAEAGFILEAEDLLRTAQSNFSERLLLKLWCDFAVFDPRIVEDVRTFLQHQENVKEVRRSLRLLYFIEGATDAVFDTYRSVLSGFSGTPRQHNGIAADYQSIAASCGRHDLMDYSFKIKAINLSLHLDRYLLRHDASSICPNFDRDEAISFTTSIDKSSAALWARIAAPTTRVAIVGNSGVELGRGKGGEIDDHDIVIRFNLPTQDHTADYGAKTDVSVINHSLLNSPKAAALAGCTLLMTGPDWDCFTVNRQAAMDVIGRGNSICTIDQIIRKMLTEKLRGAASSGLQVCAAVVAARGGREGVNFYGFSMTDQIGQTPTSANYFRDSRPVFRHNWIGEAAILDAIKTNAPWPNMAHTRYDNHWGARDAFRPKTYRLLGDHSAYHCGSAAVTRHIKDCIAPYGVIVDGDDYDALVVNGEGSMHHNAPAFHEKMNAIKAAQSAGKETILLNSVWQENDDRYDDVLAKIDKIYVREVMSFKDMKDRHGITPTVYPDFAYFSRLDRNVKVTDFGGKLVCTDVFSKEFNTFVRWTGKKEQKFTYIDMSAFTWSELVQSLKTAEVLVTGRQHAVFAACRAEIPFIAFPGNTHKTEALLRSAQVDIPMCHDKEELNNLIKWARRNPAPYQKLFDWLKSHPKWTPMF